VEVHSTYASVPRWMVLRCHVRASGALPSEGKLAVPIRQWLFERQSDHVMGWCRENPLCLLWVSTPDGPLHQSIARSLLTELSKPHRSGDHTTCMKWNFIVCTRCPPASQCYCYRSYLAGSPRRCNCHSLLLSFSLLFPCCFSLLLFCYPLAPPPIPRSCSHSLWFVVVVRILFIVVCILLLLFTPMLLIIFVVLSVCLSLLFSCCCFSLLSSCSALFSSSYSLLSLWSYSLVLCVWVSLFLFPNCCHCPSLFFSCFWSIILLLALVFSLPLTSRFILVSLLFRQRSNTNNVDKDKGLQFLRWPTGFKRPAAVMWPGPHDCAVIAWKCYWHKQTEADIVINRVPGRI